MDGREFLDQPGFQKQRSEFSGRLDVIDSPDLLREPHGLALAMIVCKVRHDPGADVDAFADVQDDIVLAVKQVDARRGWKSLYLLPGEMRGQAGPLELLLDGGSQCFGRMFIANLLEELVYELSIPQGPVTIVDCQAVSLDDLIEAMPSLIGVESPRQLDRAENLFIERNPLTPEFTFQESVVETGIVSDQSLACQFPLQLIGNCGKCRGLCNHGCRDTGDALDMRRNRFAGIDQG